MTDDVQGSHAAARHPRLSDPDMPWRAHRSRLDGVCLACLVLLTVADGVYTAFQPWMLAHHPLVGASLGSRPALVMAGALASQGSRAWPFALAAGSVMVMKFTWVYWWAGRRWGRGMLDVLVRDRAEKDHVRYQRFWELAHRWGAPAVVLAATPVPIPGQPIHAAVGAAGMSWRQWAGTTLATAVVVNAAYVAIGWRLGTPAVNLVHGIGRRVLPWASAVLAVVIVVGLLRTHARRRSRRRATSA